MKRNMLRRVGAAGLTVAMTATMCVSSFADVTYQVPQAPLSVDDNLITIAAHAQADVTPEILGLTNLTDRNNEVPNDYSLEKAQSSALIGTFGTNINSNPNPYLYNWAYNSWASANGKALADKATLGGINGSPNSEDTEIVESLGTSRSLYYRPDILLGTGSDKGQAYKDLIAQLPENTDEDKNNDYNPYLIQYDSSVCADFLDTLYVLADTCKDIIAKDSSKKLRYGDPIEVADSLTEYTVGIQSYVLEQLEKNKASKKVVAVVDPINSKDGVFLAVDENTSVQGTTQHSRAGEFVASTTENVVKKLNKQTTTGNVGGRDGKEYYTLTAEEIVANADVIVTSGVQNSDGDEAAFRELLQQYIDSSKTDLIRKAQTMPIMNNRFACCGSIGANSIENLLGMAYWTSFIYSEYLNPVYVATYWYENFYHISDNTMLKTIIATNLAAASKPEGVTTDIAGYSKSAMDAIIAEGLSYYALNKSSFEGSLVADYAAYLSRGIEDYASADDFTDVQKNDWFYDAVEYAVKNSLFNGVGDNKFAPNDSMTRAMFVTVLYRAEKAPNSISASGFTDVKAGQWYTDAINWGKSTGIVNGLTDTLFGVEESVTREQIATLFYRAAQADGKNTKVTTSLDKFSDSANVSDWAKEEMQWAVASGLITGMDATTLAPQSEASRAQVATMFQRYLEKVA